MRMLQAFDGTICMVGDEDYKILSLFKWYVLRQSEHHVYFIRKATINGKHTSRRLHRELMGIDDERVVDHIDKCTLNNCRPNLRAISQHKNTMNSRAEKISKTSKFRGVSFSKERKKWVAQITVDFKNLPLGRYSNEIEAALAYNEAAKKHFGEFAQLNEVKIETTYP